MPGTMVVRVGAEGVGGEGDSRGGRGGVVGDEEGGGTLKRGVRSRVVRRARPYFGGFEDGETDNLEPSFLEPGDFGVGASVDDDVGEDVVGLEVV